jgi:hypothetical protein
VGCLWVGSNLKKESQARWNASENSRRGARVLLEIRSLMIPGFVKPKVLLSTARLRPGRVVWR